GDGDDLHDSRVEQSLDALADRGLREADLLGDRGIRGPAIDLEHLDDRLRDLVQAGIGRGTLRRAESSGRATHTAHRGTRSRGLARWTRRNPSWGGHAGSALHKIVTLAHPKSLRVSSIV